MSNNSKKVQDTAAFTMADQQKVIRDLSNGAIFNDLKPPLGLSAGQLNCCLPRMEEKRRERETTPNPNFKVTPFFDAKYLINS